MIVPEEERVSREEMFVTQESPNGDYKFFANRNTWGGELHVGPYQIVLPDEVTKLFYNTKDEAVRMEIVKAQVSRYQELLKARKAAAQARQSR